MLAATVGIKKVPVMILATTGQCIISVVLMWPRSLVGVSASASSESRDPLAAFVTLLRESADRKVLLGNERGVASLTGMGQGPRESCGSDAIPDSVYPVETARTRCRTYSRPVT